MFLRQKQKARQCRAFCLCINDALVGRPVWSVDECDQLTGA
ncbi:hypothetical protein GLA29479_2289 [Lysobacter antibioticus]|nr:hypothetical protein GLA29479_2289 [Lysobacter antibioticus]